MDGWLVGLPPFFTACCPSPPGKGPVGPSALLIACPSLAPKALLLLLHWPRPRELRATLVPCKAEEALLLLLLLLLLLAGGRVVQQPTFQGSIEKP